jgi:hypothetical protein
MSVVHTTRTTIIKKWFNIVFSLSIFIRFVSTVFSFNSNSMYVKVIAIYILIIRDEITKMLNGYRIALCIIQC